MNLEKNLIKNKIDKIGTFFYKKKITTKTKTIATIWKIYNEFSIINGVPKINNIKNNFKQHAKNINYLKDILMQKGHNQHIADNILNKYLSWFLKTNNEINNDDNESNKIQNLFKISKISYYIKYDRNNTNINFKQKTHYGKMNISINKAKPEQTLGIIDKKIKKGQPKCSICWTNIGWQGTNKKDSRENLRALKIDLYNKKWFIQFSPYSYFKKHFIVNSMKHEKMQINNNTIKNLIAFVDKENKYFIGSNAGIPLVGGSLLQHNHFQGGKTKLPIMKAKKYKTFKLKNNKVNISILKWPLSAIKIQSKNKKQIIKIFNVFMKNWNTYKNKTIKNNGNNNAFSIIVKKDKNIYQIWAIYRNNSTSKKYLEGIYHCHPKRFNIKREAIGLIEVGGNAILPGRLEGELKQIRTLYNLKQMQNIKKSNDLKKHYVWIKQMAKNKKYISKKQMNKFVGHTFIKCLKDCNVFANNKNFSNFIETTIKKLEQYPN